MKKPPRPIDDQRDAVLRWGITRDTGDHMLGFNVAAWRVVQYVAQAAAFESGAEVIEVISRLIYAGMEGRPLFDIPRLKFEWARFTDGQAALVFRGQTFQTFCRCVDLPEDPAKELILKAIKQQIFDAFRAKPRDYH